MPILSSVVHWEQNWWNALLICLNPLSAFIVFWITVYEKHINQWVIPCLVPSPVCTVAIKKPEYVLISTYTYLDLPNSATWLTSICYKLLEAGLKHLHQDEEHVNILGMYHTA